jgi:SSS family solute:Na+ symporter
LNPAAVALGIVALVVLGTIAFALVSIRKIETDPQQFIVGGRSFGALFLWVLLAGEIYTSFTFLGLAGWAYGKGAAALYIPAYGTIGFIIGYFFLPAVWRIAKERGLLTSADFFTDRYGSKALGGGVAILQFVMVVPYVCLQLAGLQKILSVAAYGKFPSEETTVIVAFALIALFVLTTGLRGAAWASLVKDALVLAAVIFAGVVIPLQFFGSPTIMFDQLLQAHPLWTTLQSGTQYNTAWFISTVLLTSIGFYMGPHSMAATYSAKNENALRRNAIFLPLYQIVLLLVFFAGFSALLIVPGLKDVDLSFLTVVVRYYPPWVMGFVGAAGALAALVPASALLLASASVMTKNVLGDWFGIATKDRTRVFATRICVLVVAGMALLMWTQTKSTTLGELLLLYYNGITQFMPGFVFALVWKRVNAWAVGAGIVASVTLAVTLAALGKYPWGLNPGLVALLLNVAIVVAITLLTPRRAGAETSSPTPV